MDPTRKRKRVTLHTCIKALILCFSFFPFLLFLSHHIHIQEVGLVGFRNPTTRIHKLPSHFRIHSRVLFPYCVLLIVETEEVNDGYPSEDIECVYRRRTRSNESDEVGVRRPALSADGYDENRWIVRCPAPAGNYSAVVGLSWRRGDVAAGVDRGGGVYKWDMVTYEAVMDGEESVVLFVKGLNLRPDRESDPSQFTCRFEWESKWKSVNEVLTSKAITAAQEVVRCALPEEVKMILGEVERVAVTISMRTRVVHGRGHLQEMIVPSVAEIRGKGSSEGERDGDGKYDLCACTMVWNQASAIREWMIYHAWLGVERWFVYDNNSDDDLKDVITELDEENYNVTRHVWPWIKSQEAGFSHCALRSRNECSWVAFFDVDEFFYFPPPRHRGDSALLNAGQNALRELVANLSSSAATIAEMRTTCYSFGPSGLTSVPVQGITSGYTCRLQSPERHKSIVRPDALDDTLLNAVHHFRLRKDFRYLNLPPGTILINHYKYQVWESFKAKFYRRVSTYVADWQENQNEGSRDRAPGLGTEAIEPPNWHLRFCEVWDTRLRDFVIANLADPTTGVLPWQSLAPQ